MDMTTSSAVVQQAADGAQRLATQIAPATFVEAMEQEMHKYLQSVMAAVNNAPNGAWLAGSEEQVRDLSAEAAFPPPHHPLSGKRLAN